MIRQILKVYLGIAYIASISTILKIPGSGLIKDFPYLIPKQKNSSTLSMNSAIRIH